MRKESWMQAGIVIVLISCACGFVYGVWPQAPKLAQSQPSDKSWSDTSPNKEAMERVRNAHTSNFDNVLRF